MRRRKVNKKELLDGNANLVFGMCVKLYRENLCSSGSSVRRDLKEREGRREMIWLLVNSVDVNIII